MKLFMLLSLLFLNMPLGLAQSQRDYADMLNSHMDIRSIISNTITASDSEWYQRQTNFFAALRETSLTEYQANRLKTLISNLHINTNHPDRYHHFFIRLINEYLSRTQGVYHQDFIMALMRRNNRHYHEQIIRKVLSTPYGIQMRPILRLYSEMGDQWFNSLLFYNVFSTEYAIECHSFIIETLRRSNNYSLEAFMQSTLSNRSLPRREELLFFVKDRLNPSENVWAIFIQRSLPHMDILDAMVGLLDELIAKDSDLIDNAFIEHFFNRSIAQDYLPLLRTILLRADQTQLEKAAHFIFKNHYSQQMVPLIEILIQRFDRSRAHVLAAEIFSDHQSHLYRHQLLSLIDTSYSLPILDMINSDFFGNEFVRIWGGDLTVMQRAFGRMRSPADQVGFLSLIPEDLAHELQASRHVHRTTCTDALLRMSRLRLNR